MKKDEEKKKPNERKRNKRKHIWGNASAFHGFLAAMEKTRAGGNTVLKKQFKPYHYHVFDRIGKGGGTQAVRYQPTLRTDGLTK
jgi:hypothetical protein